MIQQKSAFIRAVGEMLSKHSPRPLALFGRNDTDSYEVGIEPSDLAEQFAPAVWKLVPPGSIFSSYSGWVACRVRSIDSGEVWVGMEVVVPHPTRGVYVEACYGLFANQDAIDCLASIKALPFSKERDERGTITGRIHVPNDSDRHPTEASLCLTLETAINAIGNHKRLNVRTPSLGTEPEAIGSNGKPRTRRYALATGTIVFVAGIVLTIYVGGCGRR